MLLITPVEVVEHAFMPRENISPQVIRPAKIDIAADHFVRPRFGDELYDKFIEGEYSPFVEEFIKPALAHYVRYGVVDELSIQMSDSGAVLFENEEQKSLQNKNSSVTAIREQTVTGSDKTTSRMEIAAEKSTKNDSTNTLINNDTTTGTATVEAKTTGDKAVTDTLKRDVTTVTQTEKANTADKQQDKTDTTELKRVNQNDYSYSEAPAVIGVAREGYINDMVDEDKKVISSDVVSEASSQDSTTNSKQGFNDVKTTEDASSTNSTNESQNSTVRKSNQDTTASLVSQQSTEQTNMGSGTAETVKESASSDESRSSDDGQSTTERRGTTPATDHQRRIIRARALADANLLMAKAVRYVERHAELFPEYRPLLAGFGRLVL